AILQYMADTREGVLGALDDANLDNDEPLIAEGYAWDFALQHECQHQETIIEMLALIHMAANSPASPEAADWPEWEPGIAVEWVAVPGGEFTMGSDDRCGYDNEKRAHLVKVEAFTVGKYPVTAHEWSEFIA